MQILFCDTLLSVRMIYLLKTAINVIRFAIPIILIFKMTIDVYKGIINGNDEKNEIIKKASSRIIAAVIIFLVPTLIGLLFSFIGTFSTDGKSYKTTFVSCYNSANQELINTLKKIEDEKLISEDENERKKSEIYKASYEAMTKQNEENAKKANQKETTGGTSTSYNSNLTDMTKQNGVYIKNGVFYIPKTTSGLNCTGNYRSKGYNNDYGYNNYFWNMLSSMVEASKKVGYKLKPNSQGCRPYQNQVNLKKTKGNIAATPGKSLHGWGIASDLTFYKDLEHSCSNSSCPGLLWAHEHAKEFGLRFINTENWHIQPINYKYY